jgi:CubicO group peptidase (beta-lactamase class C family)
MSRGSVLVLGGVLMAVAIGAAPAEEKAPADLAAVLEPIRAKHGFPALGGAIVTGERLTAVGATGVRRAGSDEKATREDLWHLGSCTKAMTATLIARLVEKGKLDWDLTLAKAFPESAESMHEDYRSVTLSLLLANRGGVPGNLHETGLWARLWRRAGTVRKQRIELVRGVLAAPPAAEPGTKFIYSNAGFAIAGAIAEARMDEPWEKLLRREVFEPLGMEHAGFGPPGEPGARGQPWGHKVVGEVGIPVPPGPLADNPPAIGPAGTVHASLADWARFVSVHLRGARGEETGYLEPETFRRLHTALEGQDYACGWAVGERKWAGGRVLTHAGSNTLWYCVTWLAPKRNFAVLVTTNRGGGAKVCDEAAAALIRHHRER